MQNKLQELTEKLYQEGLVKGKAEGEEVLAKARQEAAQIIAEAKEKAAAITDKAEKDAEDLKSKVESDLKMASAQCLQATKKDIENLLVGKIEAGKVSETLKDSAFIKEIIKTVAARFNAEEATDLALILPESLKAELEPWVRNELAKTLKAEVAADFSKKISGGFTIGPKDGGWFVSLTEQTFNELIAEYLRPVTRKILFGE
jgi:V/A-type H+-transporting ATPase subunit E